MFETVEKIVKQSNEYITGIQEFLQSIDGEVHKKMLDDLKMLADIKPTKAPPKMSLESAYELFSKVRRVQTALEFISNVVDRYDNIGMNMSETFMDEFTTKRRAIITAIDHEIGNLADERTGSFANIDLGLLGSGTDKPAAVVNALIENDRKCRERGENARDLFIYVANKVIDKLGYNNYNVLQKYIEELKNDILDAKEVKGYLLKDMINDFTLMPEVPSKPLKESEIMLPLIKKILPNPIEYNTRYITDLDFATQHKVMSNDTRGLSDEVLIRFNTIKALDESADKIEFSVSKEIIEQAKHKAVEAYETLDGKTYRKVIVNNADTRPRIAAYNEVLDAALFDYIGDVGSRIRLNFDEFDRSSSEYQSGVRKRFGEIKRTIIETSKKLIYESVLNKPPKNALEFKELIVGGSYITPALSKALYQTEITDIEALLSQMDHLNSIGTELERTIKTTYEYMQIDSGTFKHFSGTDLAAQLAEHAYVVIQRAVNQFDATKFTRAYITLKGWGMKFFNTL